MAMMNGQQHHHDNQHRPFWSDDHQVGPSFNSNSMSMSSSSITGDIYDVVGFGGVNGGGCVRTLQQQQQQPFEISSTYYNNNKLLTSAPSSVGFSPQNPTTIAFKSSEEEMAAAAAALGHYYPFTSAQWKELERQAMIYKYMMASVPVPPDLLLPLIRHHPTSILNLRGDQEPGRCRRTDGKKWRCSRDVAPDHKYCERHMHRGRPRSRKHVEVPATTTNKINTSNNKKTRLCSTSVPLNTTTCSSLNKACDFETITAASSYKEPRSLDLMMNAKQWQGVRVQQTETGLKAENAFIDMNRSSASPVLNQEYPMLNSYESFCTGTDHCTPLFLNPIEISLDQSSHTETPRGFIDAWSNGVTDDHHNAASSGNNSSSVCSLTLSMGGGNGSVDDEMGQFEIGLGVPDQSDSTPGGPLAEVLRPSKTASAAVEASHLSSLTTTGGGRENSNSPRGPSSVSSPSIASSSAKPETALMWLN